MPGTSIRAATLVGPERIEVREYPRPSLPADAALLEVEAGGVCGTDVKYFHGRIPLPYPAILGHEIAGRIVEIGSEAKRIHGVDEGVTIQHIDVHVIARAAEECIEYPGEIRNAFLFNPAKSRRNDRCCERNAVGGITVGDLRNGSR